MNRCAYNCFLQNPSQIPHAPARARPTIAIDSQPTGARWLPRISAALSLLICGFAWAATSPVPNERVGTGIQINTIRNLQIDESTEVFIDGVPSTGPVTRERVGTGARVRGVMGANANPDLTQGTLAQIWIDYELLGLVTNTAPLQIMGQTVVINGDTVLEGLTSPDQLMVGDAVDASAYFDANGSAVSSRLGKRPQAPTRWRISGFLSAYNEAAQTAIVGTQPLSLSGITPIGCAATPLAVGSFVELRADAIAGFVPGQTINTLTELRCANATPFGTPGSVGAVEAIVSAVGEDQFSLGALTVLYDPDTTAFVRGGVGDLTLGARLEAAGTFVDATTLQANRIFFIQPLVRMRAPVTPADVVPGVSVAALGETFLGNPQLRDDDAVFGGLSAPRHLELRGYVDRNGQIYGLRSRIRDNNPLPNEIELSGPVGSINPPNFTILGITVLTGTGTIYLDGSGATIDASTFFAGLQTGAPVETDLASYNAPTRELTPTIVQLGDEPPPAAQRGGSGAGGQVQGTVTALDDDGVFGNGFEN